MPTACEHKHETRLAPAFSRELQALTKASIPEGPWSADKFRRHGVALIRLLTYTAKVVQRKAKPVIHRAAGAVFRKQLDRIVALAMRKAEARGLKTVAVEIGYQEDLWAEAIQEVIDEDRLELVLELVPPIQSVMAQGYSKTATMLGMGTEAASPSLIASRARSVATRITKISDTTRKQFERVVRQAIEEGDTVVETAKRLKKEMPQINARRQEVIARTETMMAWTEGSVASMQNSGVVTHVSVVGCESREEESWGRPSFRQFTYRGEGTCNIQDVPIADADKLQWHPNHTGAVVPSRFKEADGTDSDLGSGLPVGN